jgi:hypothetical protein
MVALDANCDGAITPADVITVLNAVNEAAADSNRSSGAPSELRAALDTNGDGTLTASDVLATVNVLNLQGPMQLDVSQLWSEQTSRLSDAQVEHLQALFSDLNSFRWDSGVTANQLTELVENTIDLLDGATLPSADSLARLLDDYRSAATDGSSPGGKRCNSAWTCNRS